MTEPKLRVAFVLTSQFTLTAFAGFVDALRLAGDKGDRSQKVLCDWQVLGVLGEAISSSCGVQVLPTLELPSLLNAPLSAPKPFDCVVVVGGLVSSGLKLAKPYVQFLKEAAQVQIPLAGLCTGSFVLARAGLQNGHLTCVSWFHREEFMAEFPKCRVTSTPMFVVDRDRMTCAGGTSVVHLAAHLIERFLGRAMAVKALRILLEDQPLPSKALQPEHVLTQQSNDAMVHKAMLLIEQCLQQNHPISQVCAPLGLGMRQLERRFMQDIEMTPANYRQWLRVQRAEWLLEHGDLSITDIALECGFQESANFSRAFKQHHKISPRAWRLAKKQRPEPVR